MLAEGLRRLGLEVTVVEEKLLFRGEDTRGNSRSGSYDRRTGRLALEGTLGGKEIKRAYSEQVVESQARKFGWQVEWSTNSSGRRQAKI